MNKCQAWPTWQSKMESKGSDEVKGESHSLSTKNQPKKFFSLLSGHKNLRNKLIKTCQKQSDDVKKPGIIFQLSIKIAKKKSGPKSQKKATQI